VPGYVVEGTLGKQILSQPEEIQSMNGQRLPLNLTVEYISFSAHVDYKENSEFIDNVGSSNLVLVHGDSNEMGRLKSALMSKYAEKEQPMNIYSPRNCETVELYFRGEKTAKVIGQLAINNPEKGQIIKGILTQKDFTFQIVSNEEFVEFTELVMVPVILKQNLITRATFGLLKWHLEQMYGEVEQFDNGMRVFNAINVFTNHLESEEKSGEFEVRLEWQSNPVNDMIADSVLALILQADTSPASVKATKGEHSHDHGHSHDPSCNEEDKDIEMVLVKDEKIDIGPIDFDINLNSKKIPKLEEMMTKFLELQFGKSRIVNLTPLTENISGLCWNINVDETEAVLNIGDNLEWVVECLDEDLKRRISVLASRIIKVSQPLAKTWSLK
jgi:cleavage and polyadenylation specificity factor subunit 3